jgi:hypothetical protein
MNENILDQMWQNKSKKAGKLPKKPRRKLDQYFTSQVYVDFLLDNCPGIYGSGRNSAIEPCHGAGDITKALTRRGLSVVSNDLDSALVADHHLDATIPTNWAAFRQCDWVITNPPFSSALPIVRNALQSTSRGVAMLLRLSFLEPTNDRCDWLKANPPTRIIVLPRTSFTGDGKTDSVTCAWMIWDLLDTTTKPTLFMSRGDRDAATQAIANDTGLLF